MHSYNTTVQKISTDRFASPRSWDGWPVNGSDLFQLSLKMFSAWNIRKI